MDLGQHVVAGTEAATDDRRGSNASEIDTDDGTAGEFSSPESTLCADSLLGVRSTPVLPQWHVQDPGHFAKSAGGRLHLKHAYAFDPTKSEWADYAAVQA